MCPPGPVVQLVSSVLLAGGMRESRWLVERCDYFCIMMTRMMIQFTVHYCRFDSGMQMRQRYMTTELHRRGLPPSPRWTVDWFCRKMEAMSTTVGIMLWRLLLYVWNISFAFMFLIPCRSWILRLPWRVDDWRDPRMQVWQWRVEWMPSNWCTPLARWW